MEAGIRTESPCVLADVPFTKTHDLQRLGTLAVPRYPQDAELFEATYLFTSWAFDFRYPGGRRRDTG